MFKKVISMATASIIATAGFAFISAPSAFAAFSITLGSISANPVAGTASTPTLPVTTTDINSAPLNVDWVTDISGNTTRLAPTGISAMSGMVMSNATTITFTVQNTATAGTYFYKVRYGMVASAIGQLEVSAASSSSSSSSSSDATVAAAQALAQKIASAKATLVDSIKSGKPLTAADLNAADLTVASTKAAERVNAKIQTLPEAQRSDLAKIKVIVERENFVEKVSSSATQFQVNTRDLIRVGLVAPDYVYKGAVVRSLLAADPVVLATIEQVEAAVKNAQAAVQARKDRLASIIAKINGTK